MLELTFQGFFQCRLATDADAFDEPRGDLGWTFALGDEPNLDRIVRFSHPVALRTHAPEIGVRVVAIDGSEAAHPLLNAAVDLAPTAAFEGRNGAIASAGREPIHPALCRVEGGGVTLQRQSDYDVFRPVQRAPYMGRGTGPIPDPMVRGTQVSSEQEALAYRAARRVALEADLAGETDAVTRSILQDRIRYLQTQNGGAVTATMYLAVGYGYPLEDAAVVTDPGNVLGTGIDVAAPWQVSYWMGGWDADTLTAYVRGSLTIPTM